MGFSLPSDKAFFAGLQRGCWVVHPGFGSSWYARLRSGREEKWIGNLVQKGTSGKMRVVSRSLLHALKSTRREA